jgi:hypothetical protein
MLRIKFLACTLLLTPVIYGQGSKDPNNTPTVITINTYKPILIDAKKIESVPVIDKPSVKPPSFQYTIKAKQVNTEKIVKPIPVADLIIKEENIYPSSFVKLGYGNLKTPLAELYFNNKQNSKVSYGVHYRFLQSNSSLNNSFADFTDHSAKGYLSTYSEIGEFGLDVNYKQNRYNFFGYDTSNKLAEQHLARTVHNFDANAYFNSTAISDKRLKHRTQFNFYNFQIGKAMENQYALKTKLYAHIPNFNELDKCQLSAVLGVDYNIFKNDTLKKLDRLFIQIDPRFDFVYEGLELSAGFNTTIYLEGSEKAVPYVNPVLKATYPLMENVANLYVGIDGRYHKQSLRNIIQTNPFTSAYDLSNMYENVRTYIGLNAKIGSSADAVFEVNYSDVTNMPLFITNSKDSLNSFSILYRQANVLKFSTAFNYSFSEKVRIGLSGNFYNYEISGEPEAWQMPNIDGKLNMKFNIKNKLYPHVDIVAMGIQKQRTGREPVGYTRSSLDAFYDISVGADYRFKKKLSVFVQANNLASSRYQRWYKYPVYGFNIMGGLTMIF